MGRKKTLKKEHYCVILSSETDARKKSVAFNIKRRGLVFAVIGFILVIITSVGFTIISLLQASYYSAQTEALKRQIENQSETLNSYKDEIDSLQQGLED